MRRAAIILLLGAVLAGCGGSEEAAPTAQTVEGEQPQAEPTPTGDAAAGKAVYAENGCGSCHTFKPAASTGTTGPNLDELPDLAEKAGEGSLEEFTRESIVNPDAYVEEGFPEGVMPAAELEDKELADLVAFLTQS